MKKVYVVCCKNNLYDSNNHFMAEVKSIIGIFESKIMAIKRFNEFARFLIKDRDYTTEFVDITDFEWYECTVIGSQEIYIGDFDSSDFYVRKEMIELETEILYEEGDQ